jgi:hypothetical protein
MPTLPVIFMASVPVLYQGAETLTHLCHRPRPSTAPISQWTTVRFCNECSGGALAA